MSGIGGEGVERMTDGAVLGLQDSRAAWLGGIGRVLALMVALGLTLVTAATVRAGYQLLPTGAPGATTAAELDEATRRIPEVDRAIKRFEKREFDACLAQLEEAVKAHPELPPPQTLFARLAFLGNQSALIRPALERAAVQAPDHPEVYLLFANLALLENRLTDAALHFDKATALAAAKGRTAEQRRRVALLCQQGMAMVAEGRADWKGARKALTDWLATEPANGRARQRLAKALFGLGQPGEASQELQKAVKDDPTLEPAPLSMAWLYTRSGDLKKAGEWIEFAVKSAPDSLAVQTGVAAWLLEQGRAEEATRHADAAAKLDPRSMGVKRIQAVAARQRKDLEVAERLFQELTTDSPGDAWARNQLALVLAEQHDGGKLRRALELAELSVRQDPNDAQALATLGTVYYRQQRLDDSEKLLQAVVASGKGNSDSVYILAHVRDDRGHPEDATALLKTALDAPGLFIFRKDAQEWLDRLKTVAK